MCGSGNDSSNIMNPVFLKTENGQMIIQERELLVYAKTNHIGKIFALVKGEENKPYWILEFQIKGESERALLVTSLNKPRPFPRLNSMVSMVKNWCPDIENIILEI